MTPEGRWMEHFEPKKARVGPMKPPGGSNEAPRRVPDMMQLHRPTGRQKDGPRHDRVMIVFYNFSSRRTSVCRVAGASPGEIQYNKSFNASLHPES